MLSYICGEEDSQVYVANLNKSYQVLNHHK